MEPEKLWPVATEPVALHTEIQKNFAAFVPFVRFVVQFVWLWLLKLSF